MGLGIVTSVLPVNANNIFNNHQNETVNNITNKYEANLEQERKLYQDIIAGKDETIRTQKETIEVLKEEINMFKS